MVNFWYSYQYYQINLAYLQLIKVLVYESDEQGYLNLNKNLEKYVWMNSFLESATLLKMEFFLNIFQGFCLKVSEYFFNRRPPCIFAVIVNGFK